MHAAEGGESGFGLTCGKGMFFATLESPSGVDA